MDIPNDEDLRDLDVTFKNIVFSLANVLKIIDWYNE